MESERPRVKDYNIFNIKGDVRKDLGKYIVDMNKYIDLLESALFPAIEKLIKKNEKTS